MRKTALLILTAVTSIIILLWHLFLQPTWLVTEVTDGDTIKVQRTGLFASGEQIRVRYIGIDAPELQTKECYSQEAKELNRQLVENQKVRLKTDVNKMDNYGRTLAYVFLVGKEISVNELLLIQGAGKFKLDTANLTYQNELIADAIEAHVQRNGLWSACAEDPQTGCVIKGNLDKSDRRWYHLPDFRHYDQTIVRLDRGDQWFCSEKEAIAAGFIRARE